MYKRILVPTDGSEITGKAVQTAIELAAMGKAQLFAIGVKEPFPYSAISEMQPVPPQEFYDAQERIALPAHLHARLGQKRRQFRCIDPSVEAIPRQRPREKQGRQRYEPPCPHCEMLTSPAPVWAR